MPPSAPLPAFGRAWRAGAHRHGPQNGLLSLVDAKGSKTVTYTGRITTTMVDGQPRTSGKGIWTFVSGTGAYADDRSTGTYGFTMTSQTDIAGEWKEDGKPGR